MLEAEDIRDWRDHAVVDQTGAKIGSLEAVYFDTSTELPPSRRSRSGCSTARG